MRLTISLPSEQHTAGCTTVACSLGCDILTGGDDCAVWKWNLNGEPIAKVVEIDTCITVVRWIPGSGRKRGAGTDSNDHLVVACADGTFRFVAVQTMRIERVVEAHTGAITGLVWNYDGTTMLTSGEDGQIKVWGAAGIQRSVLAATGKCIYTLLWGAEHSDFGGECVLYSCGSDVIVKPLSPSVKKQLMWHAHKGCVLCADWSRMSNLIVTGGEDGMYKVWDPYGRNLFSSSPSAYPVTCISFSPGGDMFAVGSFESLRVCDKTGWTQCREAMPSTGSVLAVVWTADGTQVIGGTGTGHLLLAQLVDRSRYWQHLICTLSDSKKILVRNVLTDTVNELSTRDKIIKQSIGYGYFILTTSTQCIVYDVNRWAAPVQFDLREPVVHLAQCEKSFIIADCVQGILVFSYDGRLQCNIKFATTLRPEQLTAALIGISHDTIAIRDPTDIHKILFFDASAGKAYKDATITHHIEITDVKLSLFGSQQERKVAFIDRNKDLHLSCVHLTYGVHKLATMVSSLHWNDTTEVLAALSDLRLTVWNYPSVVFIDRDLLMRTKSVLVDTEDFGRNDNIESFFGTRVEICRGSDGALLTFSVSPFPTLLFQFVGKHDWDGATRLCRYIGDMSLWAILAALAVRSAELNTAEVAYAALNEVDKLRYIASIKEIPSPEGRQAELSLFQRRLEEAERVLLQAGLVFRSIEMHMKLYNWERALEIAVERRTHVDTVVAMRQKHLENIGRKETMDKFKQVATTVKIDFETIQEKIKQERQKEKQRPGARPFGA